MKYNFTLCLLLFSMILSAQNQSPEISNFSIQFDNDNYLVSITYDLFDEEGDEMDVSLLISSDDGKTYNIDTDDASGDIGSGIQSGTNKSILWDGSDHLDGGNGYRVKLVADDNFEIDIQSIVDQVDSSQIMSNLTQIEGIRHRNENLGHLEDVKDMIEQKFSEAGVETVRLDFTYDAEYNSENIIGRLEGGTESDTIFIVDGHFDTVHISPGADDNGSAVAGMLEILRVLSPYNFNKTIHFIGFDLEEEGKVGSKNYVLNHVVDKLNVKGVFNMEMIAYYSGTTNSQTFPTGFSLLYPDLYSEVQSEGFKGNFIASVGDPNSVELMQSFENAATMYVPALEVKSIEAPSNWAIITPDFGRSDHAPFWEVNIPALFITDTANFRNPNYHTSNDKIGTLNFPFMLNVIKAIVAALAEGAEINHSTYVTGDFDVLTSVKNKFDCDVHIFPSPAKDVLQIQMGDCSKSQYTVQFFNTVGEQVLEEKMTSDQSSISSVDVSTLSSGSYIITISNGMQKASHKVVIQ